MKIHVDTGVKCFVWRNRIFRVRIGVHQISVVIITY